MNLADNPLYTCVFDNGIKLYAPAAGNNYHLSRYIAAGAQNIYSSCGITPEVLNTFLDEMIRQANDEKIKELRTNIGVLANNLKYRLKYPVDEECALRMGAIYTFMPDENPDEVHDAFTQAKMKAAKENPELYAFFLNVGIEHTPSWKAYENHLTDTGYFQNRDNDLKALLPV